MATSGKKGKKKGVKVGLQQFLATGSAPQASQVQKKINWSDDVDDEEYSRKPQVISLPTAPRASRFLNEDAISNKPPFLAFVSNLPYDTNEADVQEFFGELRIESIKLPREEGEPGRLRGFGYIRFETKEDLIDAVRIPDPVIRNRRIRIDISSDNDQKQMGANNWRSRKDNQHDGEGGGNRRGFSFRDREKTQGGDDDNSTSWRSQERPKDSPPPQRRNNYGGERDSAFKRRGYDNRDRDNNRETVLQERPKLNLTPRTLPIENPLPPPEKEIDIQPVEPKSEAITSAKIFGEAKPVDTSARERQIEERIEKERLELLAAKAEKEANGEETEEEDIKEPVKIENGDESSWRKRENDEEKTEIKTNSSPPMARRFSPPRDYKDNRNDRRGPGGSRRDDSRKIDRDDRRVGERDDRRDLRQNREGGRDYNKDFNRNDRDNRNKDFRDKDSKDFNKDRERVAQKNPPNRVNRSRNDNRKDPTPLSKDDKEFNEDRMPKYQPQQGPNVEISNKYAMLEVDDYEYEE